MSFILVTGGAGYIGTHTCVELLNHGYQVIVLDNLSNSSIESLYRIAQICKTNLIINQSLDHDNQLFFFEGDVRNKSLVRNLFRLFDISSVIHLAGFKAVYESLLKPLIYYDNNVMGTFSLLQVMAEQNCKKMVFSSTATVYGKPKVVPITENAPLLTTNPYGKSKLMIENILRDLSISDQTWSIAILRYFNPVGAHESSLIGENPNINSNNLMPVLSQVAVGKLDQFSVFGNDYDTHDGTCIRDFIHVVDLAKGHLKALDAITGQTQVLTINLGTGQGYSVLDMVKAFEKASGNAVPYQIVKRRNGDVAISIADPKYAHQVLGWRAQLSLDRMCADTWRWINNNPNFYC